MLSEISQKQILYDIINHMWNLKKTQQTSEQNERHRLTDTKNKPGSAVEGGAQRRGSTGLGGEGTKLLGIRRATRDVLYNTRTTVSIL